jgi:outer membrane protein OmpA-like peptidoglycan-associated protein
MTVRDTVRETTPPRFAFVTSVSAQTPIASWEIIATQDKGKTKEFHGSGEPPSVVKWEVGADKQYSFIPKSDMLYSLKIVDQDGNSWSSNVERLPIDAMTIERKSADNISSLLEDKKYDKFSLISFAYNSAELNSSHKDIVRFAREKIVSNSKIRIVGYTDRMGEEEHNLALSQKRAVSTAKALGVSEEIANGVGESEPLFTNDLPEGRFYNRTVYIVIENFGK